VAASAAAQYGVGLTIICPREKSTIWGAQYLHQPIPGVSVDEPQVIRYLMEGKPEDYLRKVYNGLWDGHVSDDLRDQAHMAWDLRMAYNRLWEQFESYIWEWRFGHSREANRDVLLTLVDKYDLVVNTIPRKKLCLNPKHNFKFTEIWAMGDTDARRVPVPTTEGIITYNGHEDMSWYRAARVFGYSTVEWPQHINKPPIPDVARGRKPINHNCDCVPQIKHLGRMGRWDKSKLVHHAYADMTELLMIATEGK